MRPEEHENYPRLEKIAIKTTHWIGSTNSLIIHTFLFALAFASVLLGAPFQSVLLILTTIVSLEAIYLSIFIQMSVNRQAHKLHAVSKDVEEIQEDVEEIQEDVDEIQHDVDEIQEDVEDIGEDVEEIQEDDDTSDSVKFTKIENTLQLLIEEIQELKKK